MIIIFFCTVDDNSYAWLNTKIFENQLLNIKCITELEYVPAIIFCYSGHIHACIYTDLYWLYSFSLLAIHHSGIGPTQANNFLTTLNLPFVSSFLFQKRSQEVSDTFQKVAQSSIDMALQKEVEMTIYGKFMLCSL